jgi:hypothetical protein
MRWIIWREVDPSLAELVDLHFFCGYAFREIAELRETSERTVRRELAQGETTLASGTAVAILHYKHPIIVPHQRRRSESPLRLPSRTGSSSRSFLARGDRVAIRPRPVANPDGVAKGRLGRRVLALLDEQASEVDFHAGNIAVIGAEDPAIHRN